MRQNHPVVYSGKVGAKMRPERRCISKATPKDPMYCKGGPMHGHALWVATASTLSFTLNGQTGRYIFGLWQAS